jgi:hypothetical protein
MVIRARSIEVYRHGKDTPVFEANEVSPDGACNIFVDVSKPNITGVFVHVLKDGKMDAKPDKMMTFIDCSAVIDTLSVIMPDGKNKRK